MKANLGTADRIIRFMIAAAIVAFYVTNLITGTVAIILLIVAALLLFTSVISFCPLYFALHLHTNKKS